MAATKPDNDVTETELAVLEQLWSSPGATIRDVADRLYPAGGVVHYNTVQKLLERLEAKKHVARETGQMAHRFTAIVAREDLIGRRLRAVADRLCGGSMAPLLSSLVSSRKLTAKQIAELREMIDQLDKTPRKRKR